MTTNHLISSADTLTGYAPPLAILDTSVGTADRLFTGYDRNRDGVPDALQSQGASFDASPMGYSTAQEDRLTSSASSPPIELLANQLFGQSSHSLSHVSPTSAAFSPGMEMGSRARQALSPPRRGPSRNPVRMVSTPRSTYGNTDVTIAIPGSPAGSLEASEKFSESLARRIHHVAERWRSRFEETRHQLDVVENVENKRAWQDKLKIFELEERLRAVQARDKKWRANTSNVERQLERQSVLAGHETSIVGTESSRLSMHGNQRHTVLHPKVAEDLAYVAQIAGHLPTSGPYNAEHFELIKSLQNEVQRLRAALEMQASDPGLSEQLAAVQADNARMRAVESQVLANVSEGPLVLSAKERKSLALTPEQKQQEVVQRAMELRQDLNEEAEDCSQDEQTLALMMRVAALEQELIEHNAKSKQASATLCAQIAQLQSEAAEARAIAQPSSLQEQSTRRSSFLSSSARSSVSLEPGTHQSLSATLPRTSKKRFSQSPAVVAAAMQGLTPDERKTLESADSENERNQEILSRVASINEDLGEKRKSLHSNTAQQCQLLIVRVAELEQELKEEKAKAKQGTMEAVFEIDALQKEVDAAETMAMGKSKSLAMLQKAQLVTRQLSSPVVGETKEDAVRKSIASLQISAVSQLESELAEAHSSSERRNLEMADYRRRIAELEQSQKDAAESEGDLTKLISDLRRRIAELERELADAHVAEANQIQKQNALNVRIVVLEQELNGTKALEDKQMEQNSCLRRRVEELEQELTDLNAKGDKRIRLVADQSARIAQLERQLASGDERVAGFESRLAVAHSRDME